MKYPHFSYVVARAFVIAIVYYIIVASVKSRRNTLYSGLMIQEYESMEQNYNFSLILGKLQNDINESSANENSQKSFCFS
ncbi:hypothetical protein [Candidatus Endomicrobiellum trichonymphae]|uniref:hypothetical protein n=1 Tax=Endomicrobium trichonymphae TaxID=1408204 RepID=UPI000BBB29A1|nr:hypothetical protein [Candidatus Endomicrobium trichonymphae]